MLNRIVLNVLFQRIQFIVHACISNSSILYSCHHQLRSFLYGRGLGYQVNYIEQGYNAIPRMHIRLEYMFTRIMVILDMAAV